MKVVVLALGIAAMLAVALTSIATAQNNTTSQEADTPKSELTLAANAARNATISASSTAQEEVEPDKVIILLAVETVDQDVGDAVEANSQTVNKVIEALLQAGVNENETSTSGFVIHPNYDLNFTEFGYPPDAGEITSYTAANTIQIESMNIENASSWIDAAIEAGANRVDSVVFTLSDELMEKTKIDLIAKAVEKAEVRAEALASALGVEVVGLKEAFLEDYGFIPAPYEVAFDYTPLGVPIIPAKQTVSVTVHLTYLVE